MELRDTTAIVTGGAQGIGLGIADAMMANGANVVLADINERGAVDAADRLDDQHETAAVAVGCDVRVAEEVTAMTEAAVDRFGTVECLVNNAGETGFGRTWELTEADYDLTLDTCLRGTFLCTRALLTHMLETDVEGSIVNISSLNGTLATDGLSLYSAAKAAIEQFTEATASEVGHAGIRVNAIAPGIVRTPDTEENGLVAGEMRDAFLERTPLGGIADPEDVATVAVFLASGAAGWITGETIHVDGGQHVRGIHSYWDTLVGGS